MCVAYMKLASYAADEGQRLWVLKPKLHVPRLCYFFLPIIFYKV